MVSNQDDPKAILHYIFQEIVKYKSAALSWNEDSVAHDGVPREDDACSNQAMHIPTDNSYTEN